MFWDTADHRKGKKKKKLLWGEGNNFTTDKDDLCFKKKEKKKPWPLAQVTKLFLHSCKEQRSRKSDKAGIFLPSLPHIFQSPEDGGTCFQILTLEALAHKATSTEHWTGSIIHSVDGQDKMD